jgi:hypothetical protein
MMGVGLSRGIEIDSVLLQSATAKLDASKSCIGQNVDFVNKISFHEVPPIALHYSILLRDGSLTQGSMIDPALHAVLRPISRMRMVYFLNNVTYQDELMFSILNILLGYSKEDFRVPPGSMIIMVKVLPLPLSLLLAIDIGLRTSLRAHHRG